MELTFYDRSGRAVAYSADGKHIFKFSGHAVGHIHDKSIYDYSGRHMGWYLNGWVREHNGRVVLFTERARGGPAKPAKATLPTRVPKQGVPPTGVLQPEPSRPTLRDYWSATSGEQYFEGFSSCRMGTIPMSWTVLRTPGQDE